MCSRSARRIRRCASCCATGRSSAWVPSPRTAPPPPLPRPDDSARMRLERVLSEIGIRSPSARPAPAAVAAPTQPPRPPAGDPRGQVAGGHLRGGRRRPCRRGRDGRRDGAPHPRGRAPDARRRDRADRSRRPRPAPRGHGGPGRGAHAHADRGLPALPHRRDDVGPPGPPARPARPRRDRAHAAGPRPHRPRGVPPGSAPRDSRSAPRPTPSRRRRSTTRRSPSPSPPRRRESPSPSPRPRRRRTRDAARRRSRHPRRRRRPARGLRRRRPTARCSSAGRTSSRSSSPCRSKNHFEVLGVEPGLQRRRGEARLRDARQALPPGRPTGDPRIEDLHDILEAIFIRVGEAWEVLGDARSRASYEARFGVVRRPRERHSASPPSPARGHRRACREPEPHVTAEETLHQAQAAPLPGALLGRDPGARGRGAADGAPPPPAPGPHPAREGVRQEPELGAPGRGDAPAGRARGPA